MIRSWLALARACAGFAGWTIALLAVATAVVACYAFCIGFIVLVGSTVLRWMGVLS